MIPIVSWLDLVPADTRIGTRLRDDRVDGNVSDFELDVINRLVTFHDPGNLFEIGTFDGRTTLNLAAHSRPDARVYTLDLSPAGMERTALPLEVGIDCSSTNLCPGCGLPGLTSSRRLFSCSAISAVYDLRRFYGRIDFAFIDGSHAYDYVLQDLATAIRLMRESGIILWHDYVREGPTAWPGVPRALGELYRDEPIFAGLRQIAGTSIVLLQVPGPNSLVERRKSTKRTEVDRLDSGQPECLVASLRVEMAHTSVQEGALLVVKVSAVNIGRAAWLPEGAPRGPVRLGSRLLDSGGNCVSQAFPEVRCPATWWRQGRALNSRPRFHAPPKGDTSWNSIWSPRRLHGFHEMDRSPLGSVSKWCLPRRPIETFPFRGRPVRILTGVAALDDCRGVRGGPLPSLPWPSRRPCGAGDVGKHYALYRRPHPRLPRRHRER